MGLRLVDALYILTPPANHSGAELPCTPDMGRHGVERRSGSRCLLMDVLNKSFASGQAGAPAARNTDSTFRQHCPHFPMAHKATMRCCEHFPFRVLAGGLLGEVLCRRGPGAGARPHSFRSGGNTLFLQRTR